MRENTWYDAGESTGAYRSAGYFSQVFAFPVEANWTTTASTVVFTADYVTTTGVTSVYADLYSVLVTTNQVVSGTGIPVGTVVNGISANNIKTLGAVTGGSLYTNGTYTNVALTGGIGFSARATIVVSGGSVTTVTITARGSSYGIGDVLSATAATIGGTGSGFSVPVSTVYLQGLLLSNAATGSGTVPLTFSTPDNAIKLYQHEIGTDEVNGQVVLAINSSFQTSDLGWVGGGPSEILAEGLNKWLRVDRIEPDFVQSGTMSVVVTGRPFAQATDVESVPYVFTPTTGKIDMREQRREIRFTFTSNEVGGDYQVGKIIISAEIGDTRPYGS